MVSLFILQGLSLSGAEKYLFEAGYKEETIEKNSLECDIIITYVYVLYDKEGKVIDRVGYVEYCFIDEDGDQDAFKVEWIRL
ncbi:hypothetical protein ABE61_05270 [Lysinibacillus sphaericus]|uniref:hypothetical protein n=1 Tax=Lysinibacillus sphaericus TaxID=1421 RepID=UPI0018CC96CE|nr:hypothetical protein [Lysinibacillus sphaericus]MBG9453505.1 hypothetical protein [Lysinibacillus sphaericus]MBG9480352.1 hypothetical protein [Lysinibacillus sphaericus]MBG9595031.1 hypothetical protein [Lysinibacillus sphaericus]